MAISKKKEEDKITWAELYQKYLHLKSENAELRRKLREREIIEKAKWVLVNSRGLNEDEAHKLLVKSGRTQRKKIVEIAEIIISTECLIKEKDGGKIGS